MEIKSRLGEFRWARQSERPIHKGLEAAPLVSELIQHAELLLHAFDKIVKLLLQMLHAWAQAAEVLQDKKLGHSAVQIPKEP